MHASPAAASTLTFTYDLEDNRPRAGLPARFESTTRRVLEFLAERDVRGTFFVVASTAGAAPALVRDIAAAGHEIGCHSLDHVTLDRQSPAAFRADTARAREVLRDLSGQSVTGFRAPVFSLTRRTSWAVDVLGELGFEYSSSVLPAGNPLHGFPGAPAVPFRWPAGVLELPAPVARLGPLAVPYLGGFYLRYLPRPFIRRALSRAPSGSALWTYLHAHDFDHGERFYRLKGTVLWVSVLLWLNRRATPARVEHLLAAFGPQARFETFAGRLASGQFDAAREWSPPVD